MKRTLAVVAVLLASSSVASCSWARFTDASDNPPVIVLHRGDAFGSFMDVGVIGTGDARQSVLFGITPRTNHVVQWNLGFDDHPLVSGVSTSPSLTANGIAAGVNAGSAAFLGPFTAQAGGCWVHGFRADSTFAGGVSGRGLAVTCLPLDGLINTEDVLDVLPEGFKDDNVVARTVFPTTERGTGLEFPDIAAFAAWDGGHFAMGTPDRKTAHVFINPQPGSYTTQEKLPWLKVPFTVNAAGEEALEPSFGASVATLPAKGDFLGLAVGEPVSGKLFLYDVDVKARTATRRGCVQGAPLSSLVLHGFADGDVRLLAASDAAGHVVTYDFDAIPAGACAAATPRASHVCTESSDVTGCATGAFGYKLSHGDLDGDGDQELLVGAPGMNVREKVNAGAVYLFDLEAVAAPSDVLYLGEPSNQAQLGAGLAVARLGTRDVPLGGAPGGNDVVMFFCHNLSQASARCQ